MKEDATLVTLADKTANELICRTLMGSFPSYGLLTEEKMEEPVSFQKAIDEWPAFDKTWMIDPLDGTQNFSDNGNDFGIHIALTDNGKPVLGVNYYPALNTLYFAVKGSGAYKKAGTGSIERLLLLQEMGEIHPAYSKSDPTIESIYAKLLGESTQEKPKVILGQLRAQNMCDCRGDQQSVYLWRGAGRPLGLLFGRSYFERGRRIHF